jgi:periplasmic divalent cation tolerance protein
VRLILSTVPPEKAAEIARKLVEEKVAACVSVLPAVASTYFWKGKLERADEALLFVKTPRRRARRCAERLRELHPYEVPEIIELRPTRVFRPYLDWVRAIG